MLRVLVLCAGLDVGFYIEVLTFCAYFVACQIQKKISCRVALKYVVNFGQHYAIILADLFGI